MIDDRTPEERRRDAIRTHEIEGITFDEADEAMFEMFDREGWSGEQRRAYIKERIRRMVDAGK